MTINPQTPDPTPESARALLYRHGLPEDVIDGALCLHAQELAARIRTTDLPDWSTDTDLFDNGTVWAADLIDPTVPDGLAGTANADPAVLPAVTVPPTTHATDRAAVYREAADDLATAFGDPMVKHIGAIGASHLRRRAREIEAGQTGEAQPETPLEKRLRYSERRNDELRTECLRRGKVKLEYAETIRQLEKQLDEVRSQLGAEVLRAGQAEAALERIQHVVRRLANHAVGFQDVLDDSDRDPWARTVGADIAELRRVADEAQQQPDTETRPGCTCSHPDTEHSIYGCADGCACEWMPKRKPMSPWLILGVEQPDSDPGRVADEEQPETQRPSPTEALLATRCDACRHTLNRHHRHGACTVVLCVCGTFQYPVEEQQ